MRVERIIAALFVICATAPATPVRADDAADCKKQLAELRIRACTRIIEGKSTTKEVRARAYADRGRAYLSKVPTERLAAADFEQASRLVPPSSSDAALYKSLIELSRRQLPQAIETASEAIRLDPRSASAYVTRAAAHRIKGDADLALADYEAAIAIDPTNAVAYGGRGIILATKKDYERAIADFDTAARLDPTYANILRSRALAKSELGRLDEAIADYDAALRIDPFLASAYNGRGHVYLKKGDRDRALAEFDAALRLDPTMVVALSNRALTYTARGNREEAIADFERVLALPAVTADDRYRQQLARERLIRLNSAQKAPVGGLPRPQSRVALVIGNSAYRHVAALPNPANDAKAIAASLRRLGFSSVVELRDATRDQMAAALKDLGDQGATAEWALVYFAGHGIEIGGISYLIPIDAALKRDTHVEDEAISLARVMGKVDGASRIGLIILDSCRDNPFVARMTRSAGATRSVAAGLAPVEPDGNVLVAYAARHGTVAQDGTGPHSPFTDALLAHIEEPGLEINFLFRKVRDSVRRQTERRQEPFVYGSLGSDPVFFRSASAR
jgi:tetratricopeptide (TPR) repeat protein